MGPRGGAFPVVGSWSHHHIYCIRTSDTCALGLCAVFLDFICWCSFLLYLRYVLFFIGSVTLSSLCPEYAAEFP